MSTSLLFDDLYSPRVEPLPSPQDAAAQADAQIQLVDGAASVVFPPYARAEAVWGLA